MLGIPLDRYAAMVIVVLVVKTGWDLLSDGMRVLLDASLDAETLDQVRAIIEAEPTVTEVRSLVGRNAGRYRFIEADVVLRVDDLEKAHAVSERLAAAIRAEVPHVERVQLHYEPQARTHLRYALALADTNGLLSDHFGEAPFFGLVNVRLADGQIERAEVLANPHQHVEKAKGIRVAEWLVGLKADAVLLHEDVRGKGPAYVFRDAGVETHLTQAATQSDAIEEQLAEL
jgi:predicted Fe-Mo cluster-binding NifX family protein